MARKKSKRKFKYAGYQFAAKAEMEFAKWLTQNKIKWEYEPIKIKWMPPPAKMKTYTPDYRIKTKTGKIIYIEFKGYFRPGNKQTYRFVKEQHPELDIRFIFTNGNKPCSKVKRKDGTKQTHGQWADYYGFKWATLEIPKEWLEE